MIKIYDYTTKIGDRVVAEQDKERAQWVNPDVPNGTEGTIVGRYRYTTYRANFGLDMYFHQAGVYELNGALLVQWDNSDTIEPKTTSEGDMYLLDQDEAKRRETEWYAMSVDQRQALIAEIKNDVRVGDLPETKFCELDIVKIVSHFGKPQPTVEIGMITNIRYNDPHSQFAYGIQRLTEDGAETGGSYYAISEEDLELVERGNLWKELNGDPLTFKDINEEASFEKGRGRAKEVRNPANGLYKWSLDELLTAIENGIVDALTVSQVPFSQRMSDHGYKFDNADLGARLRAETLKGFNRTAA